MIVKPFLKWAGGKSQLLNDIRLKYPEKSEITQYCEPFVGGGAVLFDIISKYKFQKILINDINAELINTYKIIRDELNNLLVLLAKMQNEYVPADIETRKIYYYKKRDRFNDLKVNGNKSENVEKAALFIFLNKTCFNGLFRVNSKGFYNVPMGDYKNPLICDTKNLKAVSKVLQIVDIKCGDYSECFSFINKRTFVYIDPPYRPLTKTANFTSYTEYQFTDEEQIKLGKFVDNISNIGAKIVLSNSDPKNTNESDIFFDKLYKNHKIERISAKRMINSNSNNRGSINEIIVTNFEPIYKRVSYAK